MRSTDVRRLLEGAQSLHGKRVVVFLAPGTGDVAFVAGRRIGGAVERNRARRILRAAWRELAPRGGTLDAVLVAREAIRGAGSQDLVADMTDLLNRGGGAG